MAVTLTIAELLAALRLGDSPEELAETTRLLAYASQAVTKHVPTAPDATHNEAVRRLAGYLFDQPEAGRGDAYANSLRNSGAGRILLPYRVHRAGVADATQEAMATGTVGNPVTNVEVVNDQLVVSYADGTTTTADLPAGGMGGSGVDQPARDAAEAAQADVDAHEATAHNTDTTARAAVDAHEATAHNTDLTARMSNAGTQQELDTHEASLHNLDQTARNSAAAAQTTANTAEGIANTAQTNAQGASANALNANQLAQAAQTTADSKIDTEAANALIATHRAITDAHHTEGIPGGREVGAWHWVGSVTGGAWAAGVARTAAYQTFPIAEFPTYGTLRAGVIDGSITQIVIRISENDTNNVDDDHGTSVHPNIVGFQASAGVWRVFPGHALMTDPVGFTITFGAADLTITADAAILATNTIVVRVGVWKSEPAGEGGGGGADSIARAAAAQAQAEIDTHEASTHNTDAGARTAAANAQSAVEDHTRTTHNTDTVARTAAAAAQTAADAAGGRPTVLLYEAATATIGTSTALIADNVVCPDAGELEFYFRQVTGDRQGSVAYARIPAADLRTAVSALAAGYNNDNVNVRIIPHGANRGVSVAVQATTFYMMLNAQSSGTYNVRINHIA